MPRLLSSRRAGASRVSGWAVCVSATLSRPCSRAGLGSLVIRGEGGKSVPKAKISLYRVLIRKKSLPREGIGAARATPLSAFRRDAPRAQPGSLVGLRQGRDGRDICPRGENLPPSGVDPPKVPPAQRDRAARATPLSAFTRHAPRAQPGSLDGPRPGREGREICPRGENLPPSGVDSEKSPPAGRGGEGAECSRRAARIAPPSAVRRDVPRGGHWRGRLPRAALRRRRAR